ncbi:MAG: UDP-3-O-[3-hydroxymyristoyl] glucosamine N-acyltransferase [Cellvibrionaceae bacterium]|jgi:UDP-3-O-[3-hydroxymyristoyl] glucosamine N-acyltransferase
MTELKRYSITELAEFIGASFEGDGDHLIYTLASLPEATETDLAFYASSAYKKKLQSTRAGCVLLQESHKAEFNGNKLLSADPYLSYAKLTYLFRKQSKGPASIHPSAVIASDVSLGENVTIGPNVVIEQGASVGSDCSIGANSFIGEESHIGSNSTLYTGVNIYNNVHIGESCILHSGSVVGADGFGFAPSLEGWCKIYQLGGVRIGDQVEIGAGTSIDRGALDNTIIKTGVKIDNQVQIAHNVEIGEHTAIAAASAIAGSAVIGKRCKIAGCVGIVGHINITDDVHITAMSMITKSISKPGSYSSGMPMSETRSWRKNAARFNRLDDIARQLLSIKKKIKK